jgi:hypothetical protein
MNDAPSADEPAGKSLADIELEDTMRSIRGLGENADTVETTEGDAE